MKRLLHPQLSWKRRAALAAFLSIVIGQAHAKETSIPITIKATVVVPPCEINNNVAIDFSFGNVEISNVNAPTDDAMRSVIKSIPFTCPPGVSERGLKMTIAGVTSGASNRLKTNENAGAGIGLYEGDSFTTPVLVGSAVPFANVGTIIGDIANGYTGTLTLSARVEKENDNTNVVPGVFNASATMVLEQM
jgi:type 1 fimbria pilin